MKALYININGESIQSSDDIIVVGTSDDAIVDKFYYELGKEIVKGVDAPGIRGLAKHIVKSYKDIDELSFEKITKQWLKVKDKLLGENPTGSKTIELPMEYVKWLQNYGDTDHTEIAKSLSARNRNVEISLDKIYRNSVNIIINSIESDNYGQFIVNDEVVTDDSAISIAIMNKFDGIAFKPYKKEDVCPNCGKDPCECPKVCPKCGKTPCECGSSKILFPIDGITLGNTSIDNLSKKSFYIPDSYYSFHYIYSLSSGLEFRQSLDTNYISRIILNSNVNFNPVWIEYFGFSMETKYNDIMDAISKRSFLKVKRTSILGVSDFTHIVTFFTPDKCLFVALYFYRELLSIMTVELVTCPFCGGRYDKIKYFYTNRNVTKDRQYCINHFCTSCEKVWMDEGREYVDFMPMCPSCMCHGSRVQDEDNLEYKCENGHTWVLKRLN